MQNRILRILFATISILSILSFAEAKQLRSHSAVAEFKRQQPCPATGQPKGSCPGWIVDHVIPLCAGGADHPHNMQWQIVADAKIKDREERRMCRFK